MNGMLPALRGVAGLAPESSGAANELPVEAQRARRLMSARLRFQPCVFSSQEFPSLENAAQLEEALGPHAIKITFYDRDYNVVTEAAQPGRYGAVIEITPENGRVTRRYRTLFRQPQAFAWQREYVPATIALPAATGIEPAVLAAQAQTVSNYLKGLFAESLKTEPASAALLAGLYETAPDEERTNAANDAWARDRQWWVGLKRKLNGADAHIAEPFTAPRSIEGEPATALRPGTAQDAGMKPGLDDHLDALCRAWAADSDQSFAVCVARRGVIFLHRAYGTRDGRPMTVETGSWMASITKLMAGTLVMMLVDQGRVALDEPVDTHLPALRGIPVETPLTLRHLCTHTNGLWDHLGDDLHDFDEIVADYRC